MNNKTSLVIIALLLIVCGYLGFKLKGSSDTVSEQVETIDGLGIERDQLELDLQKMMFSYDTLKTENSFLMAEMADQRGQIEDLLKKVKDRNWTVSKLKKETETLRSIMKGYVVTIDSLNQLNLALQEENLAMKQTVQDVTKRNENLQERQENMENIIATGQRLQSTGLLAQGIRLSNSGKQSETNRARRADMIKACFTVVENPIAKPGTKNLFMRIIAPNGQVLPTKNGAQQFDFDGGADYYSVSREIDYNNNQMDVCIFYSPEAELEKGDYKVFVYEGSALIGSTDMVLK